MKHCPVPVNVTFSCKFWQTWTFEDLAFWEVYRECTQRPGHKVAKHRRRRLLIHSQFEEKNDNVVVRMLTSSSSCLYEKDKLVRMFLSFCISYEIWHSDQLIYLLLTLFSLNWLKLFYLPSKIDSSEVWHENEYLQQFITFWGGNGKWGTTTFLLCLLCPLSRL